MGISVYSRVRRTLTFALALAWFGPAADLSAGTLLSPGAAVLIKKSAEPFGLPTAILLDGGLRDKWLAVQRRLDDELVQIALCDGDRDGCVSPSALKLLAIVDAAKGRDGRARLGEVNRAINLAVKATSDSRNMAGPTSGARRLRRSQGGPATARIMQSPSSSRCGWPGSRPRTSGS
jgi:hypothetical protein